MRVKSLICHTRWHAFGAFRQLTPTPVARARRDHLRSIFREAAHARKSLGK
jgi:hypothetical protein